MRRPFFSCVLALAVARATATATPTLAAAAPTPPPAAASPVASTQPSPAAAPLPAVVFTGHGTKTASAVFVAGGRQVASADRGGGVRIWDAVTGKELHNLVGHTKQVDGLSTSADGSLLASASFDRTVRVWDVATGQAVRAFNTPGGSAYLTAMSPEKHWLVATGEKAYRRRFDLTTGKSVGGWPPKGPCGWVVSWSADGRVFATSGDSKAAQVWDGATGLQLRTIPLGDHNASANTLSADGSLLVTAAADEKIRTWETATGRSVRTLPAPGGDVGSIALSPDGKRLASGAKKGSRIYLSDATTGAVLQEYVGHTGTVASVAFSPDGQTLVSTSDDGTVRTWQAGGPGATAAPPGPVAGNPGGGVPPVAGVPSPTTPAPPAAPPQVVTGPPTPPGTALRPRPSAVPAAPPPTVEPPPSVPPAATDGTDPIARPEFAGKPKPVVKPLTSAMAMMVRVAADGSAVGLASDVIAAVPDAGKEGRRRDGGARMVGRVGQDMRTSFEEAVRAVRIRYPKWEGGEIEFSFGEKYTEHDGGSAGTAFALLLLSALEGVDLDPRCAVTGDITVDWKVRKVGAVASKVRGAALDKCEYAVVPAENEAALADMPLLLGEFTLWDVQTLGAGTLQEAMAVVRRDRSPRLAEALRVFGGLQPQFAKSGKAALRDPDVLSALRRVVTLAPNHLSAKLLLAQAAGSAKPTLSIGATLYQLSVVAFPYRPFIAERESVTRANLPAATTTNARRQLNALRQLAHKDALTVIADLSAFVEKAEAVAAKQGKPAELDERRGALTAHLSALSVDRDVLEKLVREGY
jgi:hypothetical protein